MRPNDERNAEHLENPRSGDAWHEMLCFVAIVLDVDGDELTVCRKKSVDKDHWCWDLDETEKMMRSAFRKWLSYDTIPGTWADVASKPHMEVVEYWKSEQPIFPLHR